MNPRACSRARRYGNSFRMALSGLIVPFPGNLPTKAAPSFGAICRAIRIIRIARQIAPKDGAALVGKLPGKGTINPDKAILNELPYLRALEHARGFMFTGRHENPHIAWPTLITRAKRVGRLVRSVTMRGGAWPLGTLPSSACARQATPLAAEEEDRSDIGCVIRHHGHKLSSVRSRGQLLRRSEVTIPGRLGCKAGRDKVDERAHFGYRTAIRREHGIDTAELDGRLIHRESNQRARAQIIGDDERRLVDETLSRDRGGPQGIAIVGAQIARNLNADVSASAKHPSVDAA